MNELYGSELNMSKTFCVKLGYFFLDTAARNLEGKLQFQTNNNLENWC
jgi:hypothetical protein